MLLDSSAVNFYLSNNEKHGDLADAIADNIKGKQLYTCPIVEAETLEGALRSDFGNKRRAVLREFLSEMTYLNITSATAKLFADKIWWRKPTLDANDKWIASLAMQRSLVIVTCDSDFIRYDFLAEHVIYLNPKDYF